jgi:hypothetical protein
MLTDEGASSRLAPHPAHEGDFSQEEVNVRTSKLIHFVGLGVALIGANALLVQYAPSVAGAKTSPSPVFTSKSTATVKTTFDKKIYVK